MAGTDSETRHGGAGHSLCLLNITHYYGQLAAVRDVSLEIEEGEFVALLGPSGCGKTTLLRAIAGFIEPSEGDVLVDGSSIRGIPANRRQMGIVFQNYALFPHLSVFENVGYGLRARRDGEAVIRKRVARMLELVRLGPFADRRPGQLSGGQQQRVALARALAVQPRIFLLDEPLSALDKNLRLDMQIELKRIQREFGITTLMVTHDQEEAMTMSDRIAVLEAGRIQQFDRPTEIYDSPANMFVNEFIGETNILPVVLVSSNGETSRIRLGDGTEVTVEASVSAPDGASVFLSVRPEGFRFSSDANPAPLPGRVAIAMPLGPSIIYDVALDCGESVKVEIARGAGSNKHREGEKVSLAFVGGSTLSLFPHHETGKQEE